MVIPTPRVSVSRTTKEMGEHMELGKDDRQFVRDTLHPIVGLSNPFVEGELLHGVGVNELVPVPNRDGECEYCSEIFKMKRNFQRFCSIQCARLWKEENNESNTGRQGTPLVRRTLDGFVQQEDSGE